MNMHDIRNKQVRTIFYFTVIFFALFLILPLFYILSNAISVNGSITLENFRKVFKKGNIITAFGNSAWVSFLSSCITTVLAFVLAYTISFTRIPKWLNKTIRTLAVFPMLLPTITYGFAIIYSLGKTGLITKLIGRQLFDFYGFNGLVFGYVIYTLPISFTLIKNAMGYIDRQFIIVCRVMGDSTFRTLCNAILKPLSGVLAISVVQSFFLSFTDFGIPASIGGRYLVISELLYNTMLGSIPDFHQGSVIAVLMMLPSVLSILILNYLQKFNIRYSKISKIEIKKNIARDTVLSLLSGIIILAVISVFAVIFVAPFVSEWPYDMSFSTENFMHLISDKTLLRVFRNSLSVSFLTSVFGTSFVYCSALVRCRSRDKLRGTRFINWMTQLTNTIPGMVLGIAFLFAFRKIALHNSLMILVLCNMVHFFATPYLMMRSTLDKMNLSWETTAVVLGDNWIKTVLRIITPNALPTLFEIFVYLFINGMVTVSAVIFIAGAKTMVITTKIQELQHFAKFNEIFILSIFILLTNLAIKTIKGLINSKKETEEEKK